MQIRKILKYLLVCIFCATVSAGASFAEGNLPYGDIGEYGNWVTEDNMEKYNQQLSNDASGFQESFQTNIRSAGFVPIEVKIGLMFMKALS